eukprot:gene20010-26724_t
MHATGANLGTVSVPMQQMVLAFRLKELQECLDRLDIQTFGRREEMQQLLLSLLSNTGELSQSLGGFVNDRHKDQWRLDATRVVEDIYTRMQAQLNSHQGRNPDPSAPAINQSFKSSKAAAAPPALPAAAGSRQAAGAPAAAWKPRPSNPSVLSLASSYPSTTSMPQFFQATLGTGQSPQGASARGPQHGAVKGPNGKAAGYGTFEQFSNGRVPAGYQHGKSPSAAIVPGSQPKKPLPWSARGANGLGRAIGPGQANGLDCANGPGQANGPGRAIGPGQANGPDRANRPGQASGLARANGPGQASGRSTADDKDIRCPCVLADTALASRELVQCSNTVCGVWQHAGCVGISTPAAKGLCVECRVARADPFAAPLEKEILRPTRLKLTAQTQVGGVFQPVYTVTQELALDQSSFDLFKLQPQEYQLQAVSILLDDNVPNRLHWPQMSDLRVNGYQSQEYQLQAVSILLHDTVPDCLHWPQISDLRVNRYQYRVYGRNPSTKLGGNQRDEAANVGLICLNSNKVKNKIQFKSSDSRPFVVFVRLVRQRSMNEVMAMMEEALTLQDSLTRLQKELSHTLDDDDIKIETVNTVINLRCPLSGSRIRTAAHFSEVKGLSCFDLHSFLQTAQQTRKWQCPHSLTNSSLVCLRKDTYMQRVLDHLASQPQVMEVELSPEGLWRPCGTGSKGGDEAFRDILVPFLATPPSGGGARAGGEDASPGDDDSSEEMDEAEELRQAAAAMRSAQKRPRSPSPDVVILISDSDEDEGAKAPVGGMAPRAEGSKGQQPQQGAQQRQGMQEGALQKQPLREGLQQRQALQEGTQQRQPIREGIQRRQALQDEPQQWPKQRQPLQGGAQQVSLQRPALHQVAQQGAQQRQAQQQGIPQSVPQKHVLPGEQQGAQQRQAQQQGAPQRVPQKHVLPGEQQGAQQRQAQQQGVPQRVPQQRVLLGDLGVPQSVPQQRVLLEELQRQAQQQGVLQSAPQQRVLLGDLQGGPQLGVPQSVPQQRVLEDLQRQAQQQGVLHSVPQQRVLLEDLQRQAQQQGVPQSVPQQRVLLEDLQRQAQQQGVPQSVPQQRVLLEDMQRQAQQQGVPQSVPQQRVLLGDLQGGQQQGVPQKHVMLGELQGAQDRQAQQQGVPQMHILGGELQGGQKWPNLPAGPQGEVQQWQAQQPEAQQRQALQDEQQGVPKRQTLAAPLPAWLTTGEMAAAEVGPQLAEEGVSAGLVGGRLVGGLGGGGSVRAVEGGSAFGGDSTCAAPAQGRTGPAAEGNPPTPMGALGLGLKDGDTASALLVLSSALQSYASRMHNQQAHQPGTPFYSQGSPSPAGVGHVGQDEKRASSSVPVHVGPQLHSSQVLPYPTRECSDAPSKPLSHQQSGQPAHSQQISLQHSLHSSQPSQEQAHQQSQQPLHGLPGQQTQQHSPQHSHQLAQQISQQLSHLAQQQSPQQSHQLAQQIALLTQQQSPQPSHQPVQQLSHHSSEDLRYSLLAPSPSTHSLQQQVPMYSHFQHPQQHPTTQSLHTQQAQQLYSQQHVQQAGMHGQADPSQALYVTGPGGQLYRLTSQLGHSLTADPGGVYPHNADGSPGSCMMMSNPPGGYMVQGIHARGGGLGHLNAGLAQPVHTQDVDIAGQPCGGGYVQSSPAPGGGGVEYNPLHLVGGAPVHNQGGYSQGHHYLAGQGLMTQGDSGLIEAAMVDGNYIYVNLQQ